MSGTLIPLSATTLTGRSLIIALNNPDAVTVHPTSNWPAARALIMSCPVANCAISISIPSSL